MIYLTFIASLVSVFADTLLKKASIKNNYLLLLCGILIYIVTAFFWFWLYKSNRFAVVNIMYSIMLILFSVGIGVLYFREKLTSLEVVGVIFCVIGVFLLSHKV